MGIEPTLAAWEAAVLPLNYTRTPRIVRKVWCARQSSLTLYVRLRPGLLAGAGAWARDLAAPPARICRTQLRYALRLHAHWCGLRGGPRRFRPRFRPLRGAEVWFGPGW
jgi:hypothetical protein